MLPEITDPQNRQAIARLATATGVVAVAADAAIVAFFAVGEPWGTINDAGFAALGVLAGGLAWRLRSAGGAPATGAAMAGGAVAAIGSGLVISGATGWLLAGFVGAVGYGLIGPSVVTTSSALAREGVVPRGLGRVGRAAGLLMAVGLTAAVPAAMRMDDPATAPAWAWLTLGGFIGPAILYPAWALWLGRVLGRRAEAAPVAA
jgi:hypothetical protein